MMTLETRLSQGQDEPALETPPEPAGVLIEVVTETHRFCGHGQLMGGARRLVDILNSIEGNFLLLNDGEAVDIRSESPMGEHFETAQVHLDTILYAVPRGPAPPPAGALETVTKVPVAGRAVLSAVELRGDFHLMPEGQRSSNALVTTRRFAPMTDVTVIRPGGITPETEPIVVINLHRAAIFVG